MSLSRASKIQMLELDRDLEAITTNRLQNFEEKVNKTRENQGSHRECGIQKRTITKPGDILSKVTSSPDRLRHG